MTKKLIHFLKIFGITFGAFIAFIGLYLGIVWIATGFKPEVIEMTGLKFSQQEYFFSDKDDNGDDVETVSVMVVSDPLDTTQTQVKIDFINGVGSNSIVLPKAEGSDSCIVNVNEPIPLTLLRDDNGVIGGEIALRATGVEKQHITTECRVYIDTPVSTYTVKATRLIGEEESEVITGISENATKIYPGYVVNLSVDNNSVFPENSRRPFYEIYLQQLENNNINEGDEIDEDLNLIRNDYKQVYWESSDTTKATVDQNGVVTFLSTALEGEVTITARMYKTYELQDNHKSLFDFEYDVSIDPSQVDEEYSKYLDRITAVQRIVFKVNDVDVVKISSSNSANVGGGSSSSGSYDGRFTINVNETKTFYLDGEHANSLGITIDPPSENLSGFTSSDLRYKMTRMFVVASRGVGSGNNYDIGNDCLTVSSISGDLSSGLYFTVTATYPQTFTSDYTCFIIGLGVRNSETNTLEKDASGKYVLAKDSDGNDINILRFFIEITTKEPSSVVISYQNTKDLSEIETSQVLNVTTDTTVDLYAYLSYKDADGKTKTLVNGAGLFAPYELSYSFVVFFVQEGTQAVDYDETYGINLGTMWYPIGTSPIVSAGDLVRLEENSKITSFKTTGELKVIAVVLRTDINGNVILVDEDHNRPKDDNGNLLDPSKYSEYTGTLYYSDVMKSGSDASGTEGNNVNNFVIIIEKQFNTENLVVKHNSHETSDYEELEYGSDCVYITDNTSDDNVYVLIHYDDDSSQSDTDGILQSAIRQGNFSVTTTDNFPLLNSGLTSDGETINSDNTGTDALFIFQKASPTNSPITLQFIMNNETIFYYYVSVTDQRISSLYMQTNTITEQSSEHNDVEVITVTVSPSNQSTNMNWSVVTTYGDDDSTTANQSLEIKTYISYDGTANNLVLLNEEDFAIRVNYSLSLSYDGDYSETAMRNGKVIASLTNASKYYLTSNLQPNNEQYGIINFFNEGVVYLKATMIPYNTEIRSEVIYQINIVVDSSNWNINKITETGKNYLEVDMPIINNSGITGEDKYSMIDLSTNGLQGTYAQLYKNPNSESKDVSTLLIDLSKFVSASYNGSILNVSREEKYTNFLTYEIISYNVYSQSTESYDIVRGVDYNKAEIYYNETTESYYLRIKQVNYNTRINIKVSTYFGVSSTYTILVNSPLTSQILNNYSQAKPEYVAVGVAFNLLTRVNIMTKTYIYNGVWVGETDTVNDETFKALMQNYLILNGVGISNQTNNTDNTTYIETYQNSTAISVVKGPGSNQTEVSFRINILFDLDNITPNGTQDGQEIEWTAYYYVKLIKDSKFEMNYTENVTTVNGTTYKNMFVGQTYAFEELSYITWQTLGFIEEDNNKVGVELDGQSPKYYTITNQLDLKFKQTGSYTIENNGHIIKENGVLIATLKRNSLTDYYNVLEINPDVYKNVANPAALYVQLEISSNSGIDATYNIRINPLTIVVITGDEKIETFISSNGGGYDLKNIVTYNSSTNNDNISGLDIVYEFDKEYYDTLTLDNKPTVTMSSDGILRVTPIILNQEGDEITYGYPSTNFEINAIIKIGEIEKVITFICGQINTYITTDVVYTTQDYINDKTGNTGKEVDYISLLEGSNPLINDFVSVTSTITNNEEEPVKYIEFTSFSISANNFILFDNLSNTIISNNGSTGLTLRQNASLTKYVLYYANQELLSLGKSDGKIETTTALPDNYSLYLYITCAYGNSYTYNLPIRINSIVFTSNIPSGVNTLTLNNVTSIYFVSTMEENTSLTNMTGGYITARSNKFINPSSTNIEPYDEDGNINLSLTFTVGANDYGITTYESNSIYGKNSAGNMVKICKIGDDGSITVENGLIDMYKFPLQIKYVFANNTSEYSIASYTIVILPEYAIVQSNEGGTIDEPYEIYVNDSNTINLLGSTDELLLIKQVVCNGPQIVLSANGEASYNLINNSSYIAATATWELLNETDENSSIFNGGCFIVGTTLTLPKTIATSSVLALTIDVTINENTPIRYIYYLNINPGVVLDISKIEEYSKLIGENKRYYNISISDENAYNTEVLDLKLSDCFSVKANTASGLGNPQPYTFNLKKAYLLNNLNDLTNENIEIDGNIIKIYDDDNNLIATIEYVPSEKKLTTTYSMQKEVYIDATIVSNGVTFDINFRVLPSALIRTVAENTTTMIIAGSSYAFNTNLTLLKLDKKTYTYVAMTNAQQSLFTDHIYFEVVGDSTHYKYTGIYSTSLTQANIVDKNVNIVYSADGNTSVTMFSYVLKIYPRYKFELNANSSGEVELFEGQIDTLNSKYVSIKAVKMTDNNQSFEILNGEPSYELNETLTEKIILEENATYSEYITCINQTSVQVLKYTSNRVYVTAKLPVDENNVMYMEYSIPIKILDIEVEVLEFENKAVSSTNPIVLPAGTNSQELTRVNNLDTTSFYIFRLKSNGSTLYYSNAGSYYSVVIKDVTSTSGLYTKVSDGIVQKVGTSIYISFSENIITVSGSIDEEINIMLKLKFGTTEDENDIYFRFLPVSMEEQITYSYINNDGDNLQILTIEPNNRYNINNYLSVSSKYTVNNVTTNPNYDFTNRIEFTFPNRNEDNGMNPVSGLFDYTGGSQSITLTSLFDKKITSKITIVKDSNGSTYLDFDENIWNLWVTASTNTVEYYKFELVVKAKIGSIVTYLKFYVTETAFKYNYAYRGSTSEGYYYNSMYVDYAYSSSDQYATSNTINLNNQLLGNTSNVQFSISSANINGATLKVVKQSEYTSLTDSYMGTIANVLYYIQDTEGYNYAYLSKSTSNVYTLQFNVKTKEVTIDKVTSTIPIINETLDIYLDFVGGSKGKLIRKIQLEILPYIQMQQNLTDTYERVDDKGTVEDTSDDTVQTYDYYLSGSSYVLDYFYHYTVISCYSSSAAIKNILNTSLEKTPLPISDVTYTVTSYEKMKLDSTTTEGLYKETIEETSGSIPSGANVSFIGQTLKVDAELENVIYLTIKGKTKNNYESYFFIKIIPNIIFESVDSNEAWVNDTTSGTKYEFITVDDPDSEFISEATKTTGTVTAKTTSTISVTYQIVTTNLDGSTNIQTQTSILNVYHASISKNMTLEIYYNTDDLSTVVLGGFYDISAKITAISGTTLTVSYVVDGVTQNSTCKNTSSVTFEVGQTILVSYCAQVPRLVRFAGYLASASTIEHMETILTGKEYDLSSYLSASVPSIKNGKIDEAYDDATNAYYTKYADKTLVYKIKYAWYYSTETSEEGILMMAEVSKDGNVYIDGEEVITVDNNILYAISTLTHDIYINFEGSYRYSTTITYKDSVYLRIVPAMKFKLSQEANKTGQEIKGSATLSLEAGAFKTQEDGLTQIINLCDYVTGAKINATDGIISINGDIVDYDVSLTLKFEVKNVRVYALLSEEVEDAENNPITAINLLDKNGVTFDTSGKFITTTTYNTTCYIDLIVYVELDGERFSVDLLVQLYREYLVNIKYQSGYTSDNATYDTIVSGTSESSSGATLNISSSYVVPYKWSATESRYVATSINSACEIAINTCKINSPAGTDKLSKKDYIIKQSTSGNTLTIKAQPYLMGDYYITSTLTVHITGGKTNTYIYYFRVIGYYQLVTVPLPTSELSSEGIRHYVLTEDEEGKASVNIMTNKSTTGLIAVETRTYSNGIKYAYNNLGLVNGLTFTNSNIESATSQTGTNVIFNSPIASENQIVYKCEQNPTTTSSGSVTLQFNNTYYENINETKKPIYVILNFSFTYTYGSFSDGFSVQYEIMLKPLNE